MAKLHFYYSSMNAGKTTMLLQSVYNYQEKGMMGIVFSTNPNSKLCKKIINSRTGLKQYAIFINKYFNIFNYIFIKKIKCTQTMCVFIDEAQFLTKTHVCQVISIVDKLNVPVLTYGLRTNFLGNPFVGSLYLMSLSDCLIEVKTVCHCGKRANMNIRLDNMGNKTTLGDQIILGGNELYKSVCRLHYILHN